MIRSTVFAFAAGTALAAAPGSITTMSMTQGGRPPAAQPCAGCNQGEPALLEASFISDGAALRSDPGGQQRSAAAALGFAVGSAAATMRYR